MPAAPDRRVALRLLLAAAVATVGMGHTPYRQWQAYRQKHLLIGTHKADPASYPLGQEIAERLARRLPESRARVTRGPDARRLASLLTTGQLDVVLLSEGEVEALARGQAPFGAYGTTALSTIAVVGDHRLVTRPDFPAHHAWQIARALDQKAGTTSAGEPAPLHPGARAFHDGAPMPEPSPVAPVEADHAH